MPDENIKSQKRVLEPYDRISEVFFGLLMVLTFTGSLSVAEAGSEDVRAMLIGALGCNIAWGLIDGILYLMGCLSEKGRSIRSLRALQKAATPEEAQIVIAGSLPPLVAATLSPADYEMVRQKLVQLPAPPAQPSLGRDEWLGALAVFLLVFLSTFPVTIPFIFMDNLWQAMRTSNAIAIVMLFVTGYAFGRVAEYRPWRSGLVMVVLGSVLVAITMALGG
jgi:VIT1/CCC1 family predicted Fe2+/Mn2+ transporter